MEGYLLGGAEHAANRDSVLTAPNIHGRKEGSWASPM